METESTSTTETIHRFTVNRYRLNKGFGVGKCIRSGTFTVGGYDWCICFYPEGRSHEARDYVSVFLKLMSKCTTVRAFYELRLVDQATGQPSTVFEKSDEPTVFISSAPNTASFGRAMFKERSELEASTCLQDDRLVIECVVRVVMDPTSRVSTAFSDIEMPPSNILEQLAAQLEEGGADTTFRVQGEPFKAHRMMLAARSPVFKAELYGPTKEKDIGCVISIDDMQPEVFKALLHFIHTDTLPDKDDLSGDDNREMIRRLLVAADRYAIERLRLICERILCKSLDIETVMDTLALADQHNCNELKDACVEFVSSHSKNGVVATEGYKNLKRKCPSIIADVWERIVRAREI